jgi:hypothetical protein
MDLLPLRTGYLPPSFRLFMMTGIAFVFGLLLLVMLYFGFQWPLERNWRRNPKVAAHAAAGPPGTMLGAC